ncbi:uncharacterized protein involved in type VI secretion and phage assembly [Pseudomonas sp. 3296]|nr:uncharacterized protein involved in type VI secretion and phage assembly [Pseudomonas sp. 3296]
MAKRTLERHRSDFQLAEGKSDQPLLVSGHFLALTQHPKAKWNDLWLLTEILHEGKQPQVLEESVTSSTTNLKDDFHQGYPQRASSGSAVRTAKEVSTVFRHRLVARTLGLHRS